MLVLPEQLISILPHPVPSISGNNDIGSSGKPSISITPLVIIFTAGLIINVVPALIIIVSLLVTTISSVI